MPKEYQTPYGATTVQRHVYQSSKGGKTFCPLERDARIVTTCHAAFCHATALTSMPREVRDVCSKIFGSTTTLAIAKAYVQTVADAVAAVAMVKEEQGNYQVPELPESDVTTIGIGIDGTCLLIYHDGWRETMVGTISLYDEAGERLHTILHRGNTGVWQDNLLEADGS